MRALGLLRAESLRWLVAAAFVAFVAALPPLAGLHEQLDPEVSARFEITLGIDALILALWAVSFNLMLGYTGMVSFAHAAYFGVGAFAISLLLQNLGLPVPVALVLAALVTGAVGLLTGLVALRAVRLYFSLLTLAISQLLYALLFQRFGDSGLSGIPIPDQLTDYTTLYYVTAGVTLLSLLLMFALTRSPFGAALAAIRENRQRAAAVGVNVKAYELAVYTLASFFAGLAGGLFVLFQQRAAPELLFWTANATPVVVALLGGIGSFLGPAIGALVFTVLQNALATNLPNQFDIILGAIVLGVVLVVPGGLSSLPQAFLALRAGFRRAEEQEVESAGQAIEEADLARVVRIEAVHAEATPVERGEPLLVVRGLSKSFGGLKAVQEVDLTVHAGDRHAIIGPNGAGKSTLFDLITGRLRPDAGRVTFAGRDITGRPPHAIARAGIGRAFQITMIFPRLTVLQNLQYAMLAHRGLTWRPLGLADRMYREEAMELLEAVGLGRYAQLPAGQLSHGDQRAIELAISLALGSRLVLLDEPTAGMSAYETLKAMELVRRVATEKGLTLLFCEHDMEVVFGSARTVTVMHQGRVLTEGTPEEIRRNAEVQKVYLGELEEGAATA